MALFKKLPNPARFVLLALSLWIFLSSAIATNQRVTRLTMSEVSGEQTVTRLMIIGDSFVAFLSESGELNALFEHNSRDLWLLIHQNRLALQINREQVERLVQTLAETVQTFETSIAHLPDDQQALSRKRFRQLFDSANRTAANSRIDEFRAVDRQSRFADIPCQWHQMIKDSETGPIVIGTACLAELEYVSRNGALSALFTEIAAFFEILKNAKTGPINLPLTGASLLPALASGKLAIQVLHDSSVASSGADFKLISVSTLEQNEDRYEIPSDYRRQRLLDSLNE